MATETDAGSFIALAGATGGLGRLVAAALRERGAEVRALVRPNTASARLQPLTSVGVEVVEVDLDDVSATTRTLRGASCLVSTLNGLADVMLGTQGVLLEAAVAAGVPRFIPSDFSLDFTKTAPGSNRNLDLRRRFHERLASAPIAWTSVLNGAFMDMLAGQMPIVAAKIHRIVHVGSADQPLDFTTMRDTAAYAAEVAMDERDTPAILRIAGDVVSVRDLAAAASRVKGGSYRTLRVGGIGTLGGIIRVAKLFGGADQVFPPWQGMQYMANMFSGDGKLAPLDNDRYPGLHWTKVGEVLAGKGPAAR